MKRIITIIATLLCEKLRKLIAEHQAELGFDNVCNMTVMGAMVEGYEGNYAVAADMVKAIADMKQMKISGYDYSAGTPPNSRFVGLIFDH